MTPCDFHEVRLVSFDFFDTIVYRNSVSHFRLWRNVSNKYFLVRLKAEIFARLKQRLKGIPEILHSDLYGRLPDSWGMEFELGTEIKNLMPNPVVVKMMRNAQLAGASVCIISDTHFRATEIERILVELQIPNVKVFTSSDYAVTKSTGLFNIVQSIYGVNYADWIHIGDNPKSDVTSAKNLGIKTIHYPKMKLQLISSGLVSPQAYKFLQRSGRYGNFAIARIFTNFLTQLNQLDENQAAFPVFYGSVIGDLVSNVIADEIHRLHLRNKYNTILYASRDGWLPFTSHKEMFPDDPILYFKTSRSMLNDDNYALYLDSVIINSKKVLIYDLGWRGSTSKEVSKILPRVSWDFVYWQVLGRKSSNQFQLNPGHLTNRLRTWRSRDLLECIFTDESNGFDRLGNDLRPIERNVDDDVKYKEPILKGAMMGISLHSLGANLEEATLILESYSRFPSKSLISHFEGQIHQINSTSQGLLVTTTWRQLFSKSRILWPFGSKLATSNIFESYLFASLVLLKEAGQRIFNLFGRVRNIK